MARHDDTLRQIPLFSDFDRNELEHIHKVATELQLSADRVLIHEGSMGHEMLVVLEGTLEVTREGEHVADIGPGGFVGELALLCHRPRNASVRAKTDARVIHIDGRGFTALLEDVPHLAVKMLPIVAARVSPAPHD